MIRTSQQPGKMPTSDRFTRGVLEAAAQIRAGIPFENHQLIFLASAALERLGGRRPVPTVHGRLEPLQPDCDVLAVRCPKCGKESHHTWSHDLPADQPRQRTPHCGCLEYGYLVLPERETAQ